MSDLISRSNLMMELTGVEVAWDMDGNYATYDSTTIVDIIDKQPTVDAVAVLRCRDCTHWGVGSPVETERVKCCEYAGYMIGENGYCLYGERK